MATLLHGVSAGGVTSRQFFPSSSVTLIRPSSVPIQTSGARIGDGAIV